MQLGWSPVTLRNRIPVTFISSGNNRTEISERSFASRPQFAKLQLDPRRRVVTERVTSHNDRTVRLATLAPTTDQVVRTANGTRAQALPTGALGLVKSGGNATYAHGTGG